MDFFSMLITVAIIVTVVFSGLMIVGAAAKKVARNETSDWLGKNGLAEHMHLFDTGDAVSVDYDRSIIGVSSAGKNNIIHFSDLISVEIFEDGHTVQKTNRGSQLAGVAVGAVALGAAGAIIGGLSGSGVTLKKVSKVGINIITKSRDTPFIQITAYYGAEIDKNGFVYMQINGPLMPCYGRLKAIIEQQP